MSRASGALLARRAGPVALLVLAMSADPPAARPQAVVAPHAVAREDSLRILATLRSRQADFERIRRRYLPLGRSNNDGRCDERIGRFCLTHDDGIDWPIPPEHSEIRTARADLIAELEGALTRLPGDDWISGQLIRYLIEARRHDAAIEAATACGAVAWWCAALQGFAYHNVGRPGEAEAAFTRSLAEMDEEERARWEDPSLVLSGDLPVAFRRSPASDREGMTRRFWALADPFFTRAGNEIHSEHLARHVLSRLLIDSSSPDGTNWRPDQNQILIRYGWPLGWERVEPLPGQLGAPPLIAQLGTSPFLLLPPGDAVRGLVPAGAWDVRDPSPRAEYEIPLLDSIATWVFPLEHQFAVFYRDDAPVLVGAFELPAEEVAGDGRVVSGLGIVSFDQPEPSRSTAARESVGRRGAQLAALPLDSAVIASLELIIPDTRHIARARRYLPPYPPLVGPHLSDLLIIEPENMLPGSLADALASTRGSTTVRAGEDIGVFWELYHATDDVHLTLLFAPTRPVGILRRIAESIGIADRSAPVRLEWDEVVAVEGMVSRAITLRIPASASGEYTLELSALQEDGSRIASSRTLQVPRR